MSHQSVITAPDPVLRCQNFLGEGPVWDVKTQTLHFVDIDKKEIHTYHPETKEHKVTTYDQRIGCIALRESQPGYICGTERDISIIDPFKPGAFQPIASPVPDAVDSKMERFNDGICDAKGRLLAGTMCKPGKKLTMGAGQLYSLDPSTGKTSVLIDSVTVSNGLGFSPDNSIFYYIDTPTNTIAAFDYDLASGTVSNKRTFVENKIDGNPDGMCMDAAGNLWVAMWSGSKVVQYLSDGSVGIVIEFPKARNITCPVFGGKDLDELYVTTASCLASEDPVEFLEGGDLYCIKLEGIRGVEKFKYAG